MGGGCLWGYTVSRIVLIWFSVIVNDGSESITSSAGDAGFGDIGNTETDLDVIQKEKKRKNNPKNMDEL